MTKIITVMNLKGGSGKTTTTAFLAHAYAAQGESVLIVDADEQGSVLHWSSVAGWEIPTIGKPVPKLHTLLGGIIGDRFDRVIIDTPPLDEKAGVVYGALRAADMVLVPMAPSIVEFERLPDVWNAIEEAQSFRNDDIGSAVVLNRTIPNASSTQVIGDLIRGDGHRVLTTTIPRREAIAQAFGAPITAFFGHDQVAIELDKKEVLK